MKVLDASVVIKALSPDEKDHIQARELVSKDTVVPEWLFVEIANVIATKTKYSAKEAEELMEFVYNMGFEVVKVDRKMVEQAMVLAQKYKVTVYDMVYAVLAKERKIVLITADKNFVEKVKWSFVKVLK